MKIVFVSGFLNNHILPICQEFARVSDFSFIATQDWNDNSFNRGAIEKDYVVKYFLASQKEKAIDMVLGADIAIFGGSSAELLQMRKKTNRLSYVYTERPLKKGQWRRFIPKTRKNLKEQFIIDNGNLFVLCASSFVSKDLKLIGFDTEKCFKFGYFPKMQENNEEFNPSIKDNDILFVGRLLKLKRIDDIIKCFAILKKNGGANSLIIAGNGPEKEKLEAITKKLKISDSVRFLGEVTPEEAQNLMRRSKILCLSSDFHEGWGAVINEALNNYCLVVASNACGASQYLIENGKNGFVYNVGYIKDMTQKVNTLLNSCEINEMYQNAHSACASVWNERVAVERIIAISKQITAGANYNIYSSGPLSKG